jgi:hypothetical protein
VLPRARVVAAARACHIRGWPRSPPAGAHPRTVRNASARFQEAAGGFLYIEEKSTELVDKYAQGLLAMAEAEGVTDRVTDELYRPVT